jgi:hypothetical protein
MRVTYIGNFGAPHSTENHIARALEANGHHVHRLQENRRAWGVAADEPSNLILWTTTYDYAPPETYEAQREMLARRDVPVVAYHLDRWWGLHREHRLFESPFFQADLVVTADGGHDAEFEAAGINHVWMPPAVSAAECVPGHFDPEYASQLAFVGSWQGGYHAEWAHRSDLVAHLKRRGASFWPKPGEHAVRGEALRNLYASVDVLVGDSCLAGGATRYWSDRIPETVGRGGFLLHPDVDGLEEHYKSGEHLVTWPLGDWPALDAAIDQAIADTDERKRIAAAGKAHVLEHHTYERRMVQLVDVMTERGLL